MTTDRKSAASTSSWSAAALQLADVVAADSPQWHQPVCATPRHILTPAWWEQANGSAENWSLARFIDADQDSLDVVYSNRTLVTRVGSQHADHAAVHDTAQGDPTSSSTSPGLIVSMLAKLAIEPGHRVLDVGTGVGYSAALLCHIVGPSRVTSIDVDPYLVRIARERLAELGLTPELVAADARAAWVDGATAPDFDRILATVSVRPIPPTWLELLRPGGLMLTTLSGTALLMLIEKDSNGTIHGSVGSDYATFMASRSGAEYPPKLDHIYAQARSQKGAAVRPSKQQVPDLLQEWQLRNLIELDTPGIEIRTLKNRPKPPSIAANDVSSQTIWLLAADGSWARAECGVRTVIHQAGPRRLWDRLEQVERKWAELGRFALSAMRVESGPEGLWLTSPGGQWRLAV